MSHGFGRVRTADLIAVLERGEITEYGLHEVRLAWQGSYARLCVTCRRNGTAEMAGNRCRLVTRKSNRLLKIMKGGSLDGNYA
jgi:hypothetical protein